MEKGRGVEASFILPAPAASLPRLGDSTGSKQVMGGGVGQVHLYRFICHKTPLLFPIYQESKGSRFGGGDHFNASRERFALHYRLHPAGLGQKGLGNSDRPRFILKEKKSHAHTLLRSLSPPLRLSMNCFPDTMFNNVT